MGIRESQKEITELNRRICDLRTRVALKGASEGEQGELEERLKDRSKAFEELVNACKQEGVVAVVNGDVKTYVLGEQIHIEPNRYGPFTVCRGIGYIIDKTGKISKTELSSPRPFSPQNEWGYHHYSMFASPIRGSSVHNLRLLFGSPEVDYLFKVMIGITLYGKYELLYM